MNWPCANCGRRLTKTRGYFWMNGFRFCLNQLLCFERAKKGDHHGR